MTYVWDEDDPITSLPSVQLGHVADVYSDRQTKKAHLIWGTNFFCKSMFSAVL